ncbi:MAG: amino acid ABC transporter substrate-binding protein [Actinobacteria bacterium]|nr:MAG: amino acid ABC transporter substrate-binding protein [Actinomycetota bacterium]
MKKIAPFIALVLLAVACAASARAGGPIVLGAVYPTAGGQGPGGIDEFRGVQLATEYVNARGGVLGRQVQLRLQPADSSDQAARAVNAFKGTDVPLILGSYGSTISEPAAQAAVALGKVFWETGAVGLLDPDVRRSDLVFRFPPSGGSLGTAAVKFSNDLLLPRLRHLPAKTKFGVVYVNDVYGQAVSAGMIDEIKTLHLPLAGTFPYDLQTVKYPDLVRRIKAAGVQELMVVAYMDDGIALRKEMVKQKVPLVASIGTSSSYCMPGFGKALDEAAVGLYASDKPDGDVLNPARLSPDGAAALVWARMTFAERFQEPMTAAALTGFSGTFALLEYVLPNAPSLKPTAISAAARAVNVPLGTLPNGSGLRFALQGNANAGDNVLAASVIWEWVKEYTRAVVWPPSFATSKILPLPIL